jgi:hypothetical protein
MSPFLPTGVHTHRSRRCVALAPSSSGLPRESGQCLAPDPSRGAVRPINSSRRRQSRVQPGARSRNGRSRILVWRLPGGDPILVLMPRVRSVTSRQSCRVPVVCARLFGITGHEFHGWSAARSDAKKWQIANPGLETAGRWPHFRSDAQGQIGHLPAVVSSACRLRPAIWYNWA